MVSLLGVNSNEEKKENNLLLWMQECFADMKESFFLLLQGVERN
jgi:hypothetical protein